MINEEWKVIPSYPHYEASSEGRIRHFKKGYIRKTVDSDLERPYQIISIYSNGKNRTLKVARLIWEAFNGFCKKTIDHIDRDVRNNKLSNLRCVSAKDNYENRDIYKEKNKYNLTDDIKIEIITRYRKGELTLWGIMKEYNLPMNYLGMVIKRGTWDKLANAKKGIREVQEVGEKTHKE